MKIWKSVQKNSVLYNLGMPNVVSSSDEWDLCDEYK